MTEADMSDMDACHLDKLGHHTPAITGLALRMAVDFGRDPAGGWCCCRFWSREAGRQDWRPRSESSGPSAGLGSLAFTFFLEYVLERH